MRRRLLLALVPLLMLLLGALEVPLAQTYAARLTQDLFIEQVGIAQDFAADAEPVLRDITASRRFLRAKLEAEQRYHERAVQIVDVNDQNLESTGARGPVVDAARRRARLGLDTERPPTAWPWRTAPMVVGASIGKDGDQVGAVVVQAPTDRVRDQVRRRIVVLVVGGFLVLLLTTAVVALPLVRWVLRPVDDLSSAAVKLTRGELGARASERDGPPELRLLAGAFNRMAASLVAALERQRAFVADASHELRNPLATLRLRLDALVAKTGEDGERDLRLAIVESERLTATVNRLLDLARAEATSAELVDFDLAAVAAERAEAWRPALAAVGSELQLEVPAQAWSHGPPDAVAYALDVLLDNARKFGPGSPVDIAVQRTATQVEASVRDRGAGLGAADLAMVGERFWRSPQHRAVGGTGLGLATSRALIESAGGSLHVEPATPGLTVSLRLPAAGAAADSAAGAGAEAGAGAPPAAGERPSRPPGTSPPRPDAAPADPSRSPLPIAGARPPRGRS